MDNSVHGEAPGFAGSAKPKLAGHEARLWRTLICHLEGPTEQLFSMEALLWVEDLEDLPGMNRSLEGLM